MALCHPFLDEALYELGPDVFRHSKKEDISTLNHVFNIYYGLQVKRLMLVLMRESCLSKYGLGCDCDRFHSASSAFYCYGHRVMDIIASDEENQAEIILLIREHCEEVRLQMNIDSFMTEIFKPTAIKDLWLNDIIDVLENILLPWVPPKHLNKSL